MKKTTKNWLWVGTALLAVGGLLFVGVMCLLRWDFTRLNTVRYEVRAYEITEDFRNISVYSERMNIAFALAEDGVCRVECPEQEGLTFSVSAENALLTVRLNDSRKWYAYFGISFGIPELTVYLPQRDYAALAIETVSGNVNIPYPFTFESVTVSGTTSDLDCRCAVSERAAVTVTTGNVTIQGTAPRKMTVFTDTGNVTLKNVTVGDALNIKTGSGDVRFESSDAGSISVETGTGNVSGTLRSGKAFTTRTGTGDIRLPASGTDGGKCEITTGTGDIEIEIFGE